MKYNKIFSYMAIGVGTAFALSCCSDDNGSNPTLQQPTEFEVFQPEFADNVIDLSTTYQGDDDGITLTWNQPTFAATKDGEVAPIGYNTNGMAGTSYKVYISPTGSFTKAFDANLINTKTGEYSGDKDFDYVILDNVYQTTTSTILAKDLDLALNRYNTYSDAAKNNRWSEGQDIDPMKVTIKVQARVMDGGGATCASILSKNQVTINVKPYWTASYTKDNPEPIYMPGNGNGWNHDYAPILKWNEDDEALEGYAFIDGEFKFTVADNWSDGEYNCSNFSQELCSSNIVISDGTGNIGFNGDAGMYFIKVNTTKGSIVATRVEWHVVGDYNGWKQDDDSQVMTYDKDNHCLTLTTNVTENGWKFARDGAWDINLGGDMSNLEQNGDNITKAGSKVNLYVEITKKNTAFKCTVE